MANPAWHYAPLGLAYPVQRGDVWQAGRHRFVCMDLEAGGAGLAYLEEMARGAALFYVDPPWTPSLASGFRTKAEAAGRADFGALLSVLLDLAGLARAAAVFEMGVSSAAFFEDLVARRGGEVRSKISTTYYRTHPALLYIIGWRRPSESPFDASKFEGVDDMLTPAEAIRQFTNPGEVVVDPCIGRGLTATEAERLGRRCVGAELSPFRLSVTLAELAKRGLPISKIGAV